MNNIDNVHAGEECVVGSALGSAENIHWWLTVRDKIVLGVDITNISK